MEDPSNAGRLRGKPRWLRRFGVASVVAAALVVGGAGIASAASHSTPSPSSSSSSSSSSHCHH